MVRLRALWHAGRGDHLVRNSLFIVLSNATMGVFGFAFWLVGARLFTSSEVGLATTLVSASVLLAYASLLGFNSTLIRTLPTSENQDEEISTAFVLVLPTAAVLSTLYMLLLPEFIPQFAFVRSSPVYFIAFVVGTSMGALNLVTDSVFIAHRAAHYNFIADGLVMSGLRLTLPIALVGLGAMGIYMSTAVSTVIAVAVSVWFMHSKFGHAFSLSITRAVLRKLLRHSAANYIANLLTMVPILLLPLLVVKGLGASSGGYFYIGFQVANLLYSVSLAVSQSLLAEGSRHGVSFKALARRSLLIQLYVLVPAGALVAVLAPFILAVFGPAYQSHGTSALVILALSAPGVAFNFWTSSLLRVRDMLGSLIWSNVAYTAVLCVLVDLWVKKGLGWVAFAWLLGNVISGLVAGVALLQNLSRHPSDEAMPRSSDTTGLTSPGVVAAAS